MAHQMPETPLSFFLAIFEYLLGFFVQPCPTSLPKTHKSEPAPDPAPDGVPKHWYYLLYFGCHFLYFSPYLPGVPGGERLPTYHKPLCTDTGKFSELLKRDNNERPRKNESISWREKFAGDSRKKRSNLSVKQKDMQVFQYFTECPYSSPVCS